MKTEQITIEGRECRTDSCEYAEVLLIQAADTGSLEHMDKLTAELDKRTGRPYMLVSFAVNKWNDELSPWEVPAVFGKDGFGGRAEETLAFIRQSLLPFIRENYPGCQDMPVIIGGYSLAALFSLWAVYKCDLFSACAAASPSVWFPHWPEFIKDKKPSSGCIYLSLGDKEEKVKNPVMSAVGNNIRCLYDMLDNDGIRCTLEWNEGNHFKDVSIRCAQAFAWCINTIIL